MVVTGREGQIVRSLVERAAGSDVEVITLGRPGLDLAGSPATIRSTVEDASPDIIVSAAAYTQVDKAESERETAFAVNERGPGAIAQAARAFGVPLIHLSTDYVFDGSKSAPYVEGDPTRPTGIYGASKLAGEQASRRAYEAAPTPDSDRLSLGIVRTAWLFGAGKPDFPTKILQAAGQARLAGRPLRVVADETGTPTHVDDLADGIVRLIAAGTWRGVHHIVNAGRVTRAGWARDVLGRAGESVPLEEVRLADFDRPSTPPPWAVLEPTPLPGGPLRVWQAAMADWRPPATIAVRS